jgi:hypothetical protein
MDREELARLVDVANANLSLMDGTTGPVQKIIDSHDLVLGIWQEASEPAGVAYSIIKGRRRLKAIAASGKTAPEGAIGIGPRSVRMKISAIPCECAEQADAARLVFGDGEDEDDDES